MSHTPGPWTAEEAVDTNGFTTGKFWIVMRGAPCAYDFDRYEDARMAAAAPELYARLSQAIEYLRHPDVQAITARFALPGEAMIERCQEALRVASVSA